MDVLYKIVHNRREQLLHSVHVVVQYYVNHTSGVRSVMYIHSALCFHRLPPTTTEKLTVAERRGLAKRDCVTPSRILKVEI